MPIKFLRDRKILDENDQVRLSFDRGQVVTDMDYDTEFSHVRRGFAAFIGADGKLTDHEGNPVSDGKPARVRPSRRGPVTPPRGPRTLSAPKGGKKAAKRAAKAATAAAAPKAAPVKPAAAKPAKAKGAADAAMKSN